MVPPRTSGEKKGLVAHPSFTMKMKDKDYTEVSRVRVAETDVVDSRRDA